MPSSQRLLLLVPAYHSISSLLTTARDDTLSLSWVRYWLVVAVISITELLLTKVDVVHHHRHRLLKYLVMVFCLLPGRQLVELVRI